jgi:hypothetical protein
MSTTRREFIRTSGLGAAFAAAGVSTETGAAESPATFPQIEWRRSIPVRYETEVAVLGGGIAGICAALAAARSGTRVLLVEHFAVTGGNATVGGVGSFCGETAGQGEAFDAIVAALDAFGAIEPYTPYPDADNRKFNHEILAIVLQELLLQRGVKLLLHTSLVDVCANGGRVTECVVCGPSGPEALRAAQFIDCTGEAHLAHRAGLETMKGRPEDGLQLPMSMMGFVREVAPEDARSQLPEGWLHPVRTEADLPMTSQWPNGPRGKALKIKVPMFDATDTESMTAAEIAGRRRMMEVLDYFQRQEKQPWLLDHISPRIGIREGRRIVGDCVLGIEDLRAGRRFDDAIARGVYPLDGHKPDDEKRTYIVPAEQRRVPPYQIPFRSLMPRGAENVLAAGRCFSADQLALSSARVMTSCAMMGQAAGIAAALAVQGKCGIRAIDPADVRRIAAERGAMLDV